jgi:hypothetical protein
LPSKQQALAQRGPGLGPEQPSSSMQQPLEHLRQAPQPGLKRQKHSMPMHQPSFPN